MKYDHRLGNMKKLDPVKQNKNIESGFQIDNPHIFVRWGISEKDLEKLFMNQELKKVAKSYYTTPCKTLTGHEFELGFHFSSENKIGLTELEFFRTNYSDLKESYDEFQKYFENTFGKPSESNMGSQGYVSHVWHIGKVEIVHFVFERFVLNEWMRIKYIG